MKLHICLVNISNVAVWIDSTPMFAFDRNTPRAEIELLFDRFIGDEDCWMDGTNSCEEL